MWVMQAWSLREPIVKAVPKEHLLILDLNGGEADRKILVGDIRLLPGICTTSVVVSTCTVTYVCWLPINMCLPTGSRPMFRFRFVYGIDRTKSGLL